MEERVHKINKVVREFFEQNPGENIIPAKDLMPQFIDAGIYENDHRNGLPIRKDLRELDRRDELKKIFHIYPERKERNTNWFFQKTRLESEGRDVDAFACKLHDLITGKLHDPSNNRFLKYPLRIDRYQRPYVWSEKKVLQLLNDFKQHGKGAYYLGSVLLHKYDKKEGLYVIDGQQRLTTLLLLYRTLQEPFDRIHMQLSYYHRESVDKIRERALNYP